MRVRDLTWRRILLPLVLAVAFLAIPTAEADNGLIHIAIAGVKPGMSRAQVRHILGRPSSISTWYEPPHGRAIEREWHYPFRLQVAFEIGFGGHVRRVDRIRTYSPRDRLPNGPHPGVREAVLHRKLPGIFCSDYSGSPGTPYPSGYLCRWFPVKANAPCGPNLQFFMHNKGGRVVYMDLVKDDGEGCP